MKNRPGQFHLSTEEITELGKIRIPLEIKLREFIPDVGDEFKDSLAEKLKSLNGRFSRPEIMASKEFRDYVQKFAHGINPLTTEKELDDYKSNHNTLNIAIDLLIEKRNLKEEAERVEAEKIEAEKIAQPKAEAERLENERRKKQNSNIINDLLKYSKDWAVDKAYDLLREIKR